MSYFPNVREDINYNENYLNQRDKDSLSGFDWCVEDAVDTFFDNIDFIESDHIEKFMSEKLPDEKAEEYSFFGPAAKEERRAETYGDYFRMMLLRWIEISRNKLVASMMDNMDDDEYGDNKDKYLKEEAKYSENRD